MSGVLHQISVLYTYIRKTFAGSCMQLKQLVEQFLEDNRETLASLDQEARLYSTMVVEKFADQLDLAYRKELLSIETAMQRAEKRVEQLETRINELEGKNSDDG